MGFNSGFKGLILIKRWGISLCGSWFVIFVHQAGWDNKSFSPTWGPRHNSNAAVMFFFG